MKELTIEELDLAQKIYIQLVAQEPFLEVNDKPKFKAHKRRAKRAAKAWFGEKEEGEIEVQ